ncbi:MAG: truA [Chthoniobacteraceae bacterium]|nr:truA [Chthoniobacteraceae bacterium]
MSKVRLKMQVAYDGGPFRGWQSQAGGEAIQDHIERAFFQLCGERIVVHGAGRTDSGVHALAQVAHADVPDKKLTLPRWLTALNSFLPGEIRILKVTRARADFHARFDASGKIYAYRIWNSPVLHPLERGRVWHFPTPLDIDRIRACARMLEGRHDFGGFAANRGKPGENTVRTIHRISVQRRGALITVRFHGEGFLYRMVRLLIGTMARVGQGRAELERIGELLAGEGRIKSSFAAPAEGLFLVRVTYKTEIAPIILPQP